MTCTYESRTWIARTSAIVAIATGLAASPADAATSFRIVQLYSNLDGSRQYVQLREMEGRNGEHRLAGLTLRVTRKDGTTREVVLPRDLPSESTAGRDVLVTTPAGVSACCDPDPVPIGDEGRPYVPKSDYFVIPHRFLPLDGGTVEFAGVDQVAYSALPTDGERAIDRDGNVVPATVSVFWFATGGGGVAPRYAGPFAVTAGDVVVREYYHAGLDHYFITASATDMEALDAGKHPGWTLSSANVFRAGTLSTPGFYDPSATVETTDTVPVCRYYLPPPAGDTHFFSAFPAECAAVGANTPGAVLESSAAFFVLLPDPTTGNCPEYYWYLQVFRLWNGKDEANHRYTGDAAVRDAMIAQGWIPEGYGPDGVAFCAVGPYQLSD